MLKFVNEERALQGLEPLNKLTYAEGVELTKMIGPGPRTKETSDIHDDFDRGITTASKTKTVDGETSFSHEIKRLDGGMSGFGGGGIVPAPYPVGNNILGLSPSFSGLTGYNKGGKVPGSGTGDTVPAMLTPGEFVMSKGAVDQIGTDKLMAMNKAGGGTNIPKLMKFAGGGMVPGIDPPSKRKGKVTIIRAGGSQSSPQASGSGDGGYKPPSFSSTDPNNMNKVVIKSLYNMVG